MNLSLIKDFFTLHANVQAKRMNQITQFLSKYPKIGMFSLFKQLTMASVPSINAIHFKRYMLQYTNNLEIIQPNELCQAIGSKDPTDKKFHSSDQILEKGIMLFLNVWGNSYKEFSFQQFTKFMRGEESLPDKSEQIPYPAKKKLYQLIESQIQGLLNLQTLRQLCQKEYRNIADLFEVISSNDNHKIDKVQIINLYLKHAERMDDQFFKRVQKRLKLPMDFDRFYQMLKSSQIQNSKVKQRKIFYSSVKRKKQAIDYFQQPDCSPKNSRVKGNFETPKVNKMKDNRCMTSTKMTKGQKITQARQTSNKLRKTQFQEEESIFFNNNSPQQIQILGQILAIEQAFIQLKRNLCYQKDFDLELIYERQGEKFENLLNSLYGACNFTNFVRFIIPQDFQHRYLSFIKYEKSNFLSTQTVDMINEFLQRFQRKESEIERLWERIDRQMMFRMYCNPCDSSIKGEQLMKYFTQREAKVLLERMDPLRSGLIVFENFK